MGNSWFPTVLSPAAAQAPGDHRRAVKRVLLAALAINVSLTLRKLVVGHPVTFKVSKGKEGRKCD